MKRGSTLFLRFVICLMGVGVLAAMVWFPQTEGRAANLDLVSIYSDPFIVYIYIGSIPFFVGLYQAFKLLHLVDANRAFSKSAIDTLKNIKYASFCLIGVIAIAELYIRFFVQGDDPAGPTAVGILVSFTIIVIAATSTVAQKLLQHAVDIKSENDLTI